MQCLVFTVLALVSFSSAFVVDVEDKRQACNQGPKFWCRDQDTAKLCETLPYCEQQWNMKVFKSNGKADASPVKVSLYFESLCPGCRAFIKSQLFPTWQRLQDTGILDVELVPYGNAREYQYGKTWVFQCQHGAAECVGNLIESCALHLMAHPTQHMPFIHCLEQYGPTETNAKYCAGLSKIDYSQIDNCVKGSEGNYLEHLMGLKTEALNPPHQYVPWITANGVHTDAIQSAIQSDMLRYVCDNYQGTKPAACNGQLTDDVNHCHKE